MARSGYTDTSDLIWAGNPTAPGVAPTVDPETQKIIEARYKAIDAANTITPTSGPVPAALAPPPIPTLSPVPAPPTIQPLTLPPIATATPQEILASLNMPTITAPPPPPTPAPIIMPSAPALPTYTPPTSKMPTMPTLSPIAPMPFIGSQATEGARANIEKSIAERAGRKQSFLTTVTKRSSPMQPLAARRSSYARTQG